MKTTKALKLRRGPLFDSVVALMIGLTVQIGFVQVSPLYAIETPVVQAPSTLTGQAPERQSTTAQRGSAEDAIVTAQGDAVGWLDPTVEANFNDRFIQELLDEIGLGFTNAFNFVRDQIGYEAYEGSLRGVRGTLWSKAGNSLDQASLLIALLRAQDIPAQYVRGTLSPDDARLLIRSMFDPVVAASAVGYIPERFPIYDPEADPGLLRWSADHWWVALEDGTQLDPVFAGSAVSQTRGTPVATFFEVPDELRHKVVVRLKAELHNPLSQYTYQTPLEVTFSTPEVYGRALTLGHFINVYQPPALVTGWKTYTYSPYLMVDDNDTDWGNNHLIRGTDYQEFLTGLFPLANSTLTRLTLEFEVHDPGKAPDIRTRDLLDRVGYAARKGLAQPGAVDTTKPALTELDVTTFFITPGFIAPDVVPPHQAILAGLDPEMTALGQTMSSLTNKPVASLTANDQAAANRYSTLNRAAIISGGSVVAGAFLLDSDHYLRQMRDAHLTRAYYNTPRVTLFETHVGFSDDAPTTRMGLDLRRNQVLAVPYPGQSAFNFFAFNMAKGRVDSILEYLTVEHFLAEDFPEVRRAASPVKVLQEAKAQGVRIEVLRGEEDVPTRLEPLPLSAEAKARIADALRSGHAVNVPAQMITVDGRPSIGWWQIDLKTGEVVAVGEDGGNQDIIDFGIIVALVVVAGMFVLSLLGGNINNMFTKQESAFGKFKPFDHGSSPNSPSVLGQNLDRSVDTSADGMGDTGVTINADGSATCVIYGKQVNISAANLDKVQIVFETVGSTGSVIDWTGGDVEVIFKYSPGALDPATNPPSAGPDFGLGIASERSFVIKHCENQVPSAYRVALDYAGLADPGNLSAYLARTNETFFFRVTGTNTGNIWGTDIYTDTSPLATAAVHAGILTNGQTGTVKVKVLAPGGTHPATTRNGVTSRAYSGVPPGDYRFEALDSAADASRFSLSGQSPAGWHLLFARTNVAIPPGVTGQLSVFLQPDETTALPAPGAAVDFTLAVSGGRADPTAVVTQQLHFVMPGIRGVKLERTPETIYSSPNGTNAAELVVLNTGNMDETVTLTLPPPAGFVLSGLTSPITLGPGGSVTQTVTFVAQNVSVNTDHYSTWTAQFGPTNGLTKELDFHVHVAVPGALEALQAANDARALGRAALAETLDSLGKGISQLYGAPTNQIQRSRVLASLAALAGQLDDPLLSPFAPNLLAARDQLAAAAVDQVATALEALGSPMRAFTEFLRVLSRHDFELALQPNVADAQPQSATSFGLYLKNKGTQPTTYRIDLSGVPSGITGGLTRTNITLLPGQATSPTLSGVDHVAAVLTQPTNQLTTFDFTVTVTAEAAARITRNTVGSFTARAELVQVLEVRTDPVFLEPKWEQTEIGLITGGDAGEGLDLDGDFLYAVNVGGNAVGRIRDAEFTGPNVPGVTLTAVWTGPAGHPRMFGTNDNDKRLETVIFTDRYGGVSNPIGLELANLTSGRPYKLQLLFAEDWTLGRGFDVFVDGTIRANDFNIGGEQGGVSLSNRAVVVTHEFLAAGTAVNIRLSGSNVAGFNNRDPLLCGFTLEALPQKWVNVSARVLNAVNVNRPVRAHFTVKDAAGTTVFESAPQRFDLSVLSSLDEFALGGLDPTSLAPGVYRIEVKTTELDGTPLAGGAGSGTFLLGSPATAKLTCSATNLPPGNRVVDMTLNVASEVDFGINGVQLIGLRATPGTAQFLALAHGMAYVGGTESGEIMAVANPWNPQVVGQLATNEIATTMFGNYLLQRQGFALDVLGLDDQAQPALIGSCGAGFSGSTYPTHFFTHGNVAFANALIFGYGSTAINFARGDLVSYDLTNPTNPVPLGLLFNSPHAAFTNYVGSDYFIGQAAAKDGIVLLPSSTGKDAAASGTGRLIFADARTPGQVVTNGELLVAGTRVLTAVAVSGNRALVLGNTDGFVVRNGLPVAAGDMTATVLDVTDPWHPSVLGVTQTLPSVDEAVRWKVHAFPGQDGLFFLSDVTQDGEPALWVLDTLNPTNLQTMTVEVPGVVKFAEFKDGLLYTAGSYGVAIHDLGGRLGVPIVATVEVPKGANTSVVDGSFNLVPDQILSNEASDTLVWQFNLSRELPDRELRWQMGVTNLDAGELRPVALGGEVQFAAWGTTSSVALAPVNVTGQKLLRLEPVAQSAQPGQPAVYSVVITNPTPTTLHLDLAVRGLPPEWVQLASSFSVEPGSATNAMLVLTTESATALGDRSFCVEMASAGLLVDSVAGVLTVNGLPSGVMPSRGIVVSLDPTQATAGQGTPAQYVVRLVNTGNTTEQFALSAQVPVRFSAQFSAASVEVLPGLDNYREVRLTVTPSPGTAAGDVPFMVTAISTTDAAIQHQATGTVSVVDRGVALILSPTNAPPGSVLALTVANTGLQRQTFDLSLGGSAAPSATLPGYALTLAAGDHRTVSLSVADFDYGYPGELSLLVLATARDNTNVQACASATIAVPTLHGLTAGFEPATVRLPGPGRGFALLMLRNTGNTEDAFSLRIASMTGPLTASLRGLNGQLAQQIGSLRLPGLASGVVLLQADMAQAGTGTVQVAVASLNNSNLTAQATVTFRSGVRLEIAPEQIIELTFVPAAGKDHFIEYRESLQPDAGDWLELPGGPYNREFYYLGTPANAAAFAPDFTDTNRLFLDAGDRPSRYYRLRLAGSTGPPLRMQFLHVRVLKFDPVPGFDHFVQYTDALGADAPWWNLPRGPHNYGLAFDPPTERQRFYRVLIQPQ